MTTPPWDAKIEAYAAQLTNDPTLGGLKVYVWGWQTICDELEKHPQIVKRFYGWGRQAAIVTVSIACLLALIVGLTLIFSNARIATNRDVHNATATDLRSSIDELSSVESTFTSCERLYSSYSFIYYEALTRDCASPIKTELKLLDDTKQRFSSKMTQDALQEFSAVVAAIDAQAALDRRAVSSTRLFEDEVAESWINLCDIGRTHRTALSVFESDKNQRFGREALNAQLQDYFTIRDFVSPEIAEMKARLAVASRNALGESSPAELTEQANALGSTIDKALAYEYHPSTTPLTFARVKNMTSRDFRASGPLPAGIEKILWHRLFQQLTSVALLDHRSVDERLVDCGILKPSVLTAHTPPLPDGFSHVESL